MTPDVTRSRSLFAADRRPDFVTRAALLLLAITITFAISGRTLWIDEFSTAAIAAQPHPLAALRYAATELGSEALMPGWVVLTNLAGVIFGTSELGLRLPNAIFLGVGVLVMAGVGPRKANLGPALALFVLPFVWYYGHEARPYALQLMLGALWIRAAWLVVSTGFGRGLLGLGAVTAALVWSGLTAGIVGAALTLTLLVIALRQRSHAAHTMRVVIGTAIICLPALGYYAYSVLFEGTSGARLWQVGLPNLAFSAYEILGFVGLGPGRLELRDAALSGLTTVMKSLMRFGPPLAALVAAWLLAAAAVSWSSLMTSNKGSSAKVAVGRFVRYAASACVVAVLALFFAASIANFPVWGRHFAPVVPTLAGIVGLSVQVEIEKSSGHRKILVGIAASVIVGLLAWSSLQIRLAERHQVEDYETAAAVAEVALESGMRVAWFAASLALDYYGLDDSRGGRILVREVPSGAASEPYLIVLSKPDIHDPSGAAASLVVHQRLKDGCSFFTRGFEFYASGDEDGQLCRMLRGRVPTLVNNGIIRSPGIADSTKRGPLAHYTRSTWAPSLYPRNN